MSYCYRLAGALALSLAAAGAAPAAERPATKRPEVLEKLVSCRTIADTTARLACYDAQVARLDEAESRKELVVVDRAEVRKARKGLFGLTLPDLGGLFGGGGDDDKEEAVTEIQSTVKSASMNGVGKWVVYIEDGARWVQTDTTRVRIPKPGMPIRIRKAAMGSFFANVGDRPAFRVQREN